MRRPSRGTDVLASPQCVHPSTHAIDIVAFAQDRLGFRADPDQLPALDHSVRRGILNCCRQWGKSTTVAIRAVHQAVHCPGSLTIVAAPCESQSAEFIRKAAEFLRQLGIRARGDGVRRASLLLPNGSRIVGLPADADTTRGFSNVALLLIDEASRVPDEFYESLRPMLATNPSASLWLMSTPNGRQGFFYDVWTQGGPSWTRIEAPATRCPRIRPEFLEDERRATTNDSFRQEYLCEFVRADGAYFDPDLVAAAFRRGDERRRLEGRDT